MFDEKDMLVGKVLRQLREEQGLTQAQVAERYHSSQSTVSKLEKGEMPLYVRDCFAYADALGVLPDMLYHRAVRAHVDFVRSQREG